MPSEHTSVHPIEGRIVRGPDVWTEGPGGAAGAGGLGAAWDDLFRRAHHAAPHASRAWVSAVETAAEGETIALTVWHGERLIGLLVLSVRKCVGARIARPLGTGVPGYLGVLVDPAFPDAARRLADLARGCSIDAFATTDLAARDEPTTAFFAALAERGFAQHTTRRNICHRITLGRTFERYLHETKTGRRRRKLRHELRQIERMGSVRIDRFEGEAFGADILQRIATIQARSWMQRRGAAVLGEPVYRARLARMARSGLARAWILSVDGRDAAFVISLEAHEVLHYAWTAFDLAYESLSVGKALTARVIQDACQDDFQALDFGHGEAEYKAFWASDASFVDRVVVGRGVRGRAAVLAFAMLWHRGTRGVARWVLNRARRPLHRFRPGRRDASAGPPPLNDPAVFAPPCPAATERRTA